MTLPSSLQFMGAHPGRGPGAPFAELASRCKQLPVDADRAISPSPVGIQEMGMSSESVPAEISAVVSNKSGGIGLQQLRAAFEAVHSRVYESLLPVLLPTVTASVKKSLIAVRHTRDEGAALRTTSRPVSETAGFDADDRRACEVMLDCLRLLGLIWHHQELRVFLSPRFLTVELAALLQLLESPASSEMSADEQTIWMDSVVAWSTDRLHELLFQEAPVSLLESLGMLLRLPNAPVWLRTAAAQRMSQVVRRPGGVLALLMTIRGSQGEPHGQAAALAARLLSTPPRGVDKSAYYRSVCGQVLLLLHPDDGEVAVPLPLPSAPGASERRAGTVDAPHLRAACCQVAAAMAVRAPAETARFLAVPLLSALLPLGDTVHDGGVSGPRNKELAVRRLSALLSAAPPTAALCDTLLDCGALSVAIGHLVAATPAPTKPAANASANVPANASANSADNFTANFTTKSTAKFARLPSPLLGALRESASQLIASASRPERFLLDLLIADEAGGDAGGTEDDAGCAASIGGASGASGGGGDVGWCGAARSVQCDADGETAAVNRGSEASLCSSNGGSELGSLSPDSRASATTRAADARDQSGALRVELPIETLCCVVRELLKPPSAQRTAADLTVAVVRRVLSDAAAVYHLQRAQGTAVDGGAVGAAWTGVSTQQAVTDVGAGAVHGASPHTSGESDLLRPLQRDRLLLALSLLLSTEADQRVAAHMQHAAAGLFELLQALLDNVGHAHAQHHATERGSEDVRDGASCKNDHGGANPDTDESGTENSEEESQLLLLCLTICASMLTLLEADRVSFSQLKASVAPQLLPALQAHVLHPSREVAEAAAALAARLLCLPASTDENTDASEGVRRPLEGAERDLRMAMDETISAEVPMRAKGLDTLRRLLLARDAAALGSLERVLGLCELQLRHDESYVYQAALNALAAAAEVKPDLVLPRLAAQLRAKPGSVRAPAAAAGATAMDEDAARRLKVAQALSQSVLRLGDTLPAHVEPVMHALLVGIRDVHPAVCASCLACLAQVSATLKLAIHPWSTEVLLIAEGVLALCTDAQARRAAAYLVAALLQVLGPDALHALDARQLKALLARLRIVRDGCHDDLLREHAESAIAQLSALAKALIMKNSQAPPRLTVTMP